MPARNRPLEAPAPIGLAPQSWDALCTSTEGAIRLKQSAMMRRALGHSAEAEEMEAAATAFLSTSHVTGPIPPGNGGEMIVATREALANIPGTIDTVRQSPGMLAATASRARLELLQGTGGDALAMAVDTAESIQPKNNLEKMLAHQLSTVHRMAMLFANEAAALLHSHTFDRNHKVGMMNGRPDTTQTVEACRLLNASTRAMASFQDGMVALDRVRRGGRQTVKVIHQHVAIGAGGQAVVAGTVKGAKRLGGHAGENRTGVERKNGR